jgi:cold shock CspA family protein
MQKGLEISFHGLDASPAIEHEIREYVTKLEKFYERLVGCRVVVEAQHRQHRTGNVFDVHIELFVPGQDIVVSRAPHKPKEKYATPDIHTSLREAFEAAERQLKDYKAQLQGEVKVHAAPFQGQVAQLYANEDHGFILTATGTQLYFHRNSLMNGDFEKLRRGDRVHYIEATGDTGPTASKVWVGSEQTID